ncbi:MAG: NAD(P)H-hydrate dehydratase [Pseudomonadota bacterium]
MTADLESDTTGALYSVRAVREIDRLAIEERGIPGYELMTRAGRAAVDYARRRFPNASRWTIVCGGGNNAGDGYVVARLAAEGGVDVTTVAVAEPTGLKGDAAQAFADFRAAGLAVRAWEGAIADAGDLLIDALLGSGLTREISGEFHSAVVAINLAHAPILALDIPTGLDGDSGRIHGIAVRADATITFVGKTAGLYLGVGPECCGDIEYCELDLPADCFEGVEATLRLIPDAVVGECLPSRQRDAHKGAFGHVVVVGGGPGMPGAVRLAGESALRSGAGLVTVATHPTHAAQIPVGRPELMVQAVDGKADTAHFESLLQRASVIAVGPGLGQSVWAQSMLQLVLEAAAPLVMDADALNLIAGTKFNRADSVLTPHPGEAGRLLGIDTAAVQADRLGAVRVLASRYGSTAVLKGAGSLISAGASAPWLCRRGNPGMAAPGMGDALTGIIAALIAQGLSAETAAVCGVDLHARAGDAAASPGQRGLLASDLIDALRPLVNP